MKEGRQINRGIYIAVNGLMSRQMQQDILAENIANINTPGYKARSYTFSTFNEALIHSVNKGGVFPIGIMPHSSMLAETRIDFSMGSIMETNAEYDFAILEDGLFIVETPDGDLYTRAGAFRIDEDGFLVTKEGYRVIGEYDDYIYVENGELDQALIVANPRVEFLLRVQDGYYQLLDMQQENIVANPQIKRGFLENSNVDLGQAMSETIEALRMFQINQRMFLAQDEILKKGANEIGSLR